MQETATAARERRYIYSGESRASTSGYALRPNRKGTKRHVSTFSIIMALFGLGAAIVLYVNNIIAVNLLARERDEMSRRLQEIENVNRQLQAEVSRKAALERIGTVAAQELGLHRAAERPEEFTIDESRLEKLR